MIANTVTRCRRGAKETELALRLYYLGCTKAMAKLSRMGLEPAPDETNQARHHLISAHA